MVGTTSGLGGFMSGASIRFSKMKSGTGGADAWRDAMAQSYSRSTSQRSRTTGTKVPRLNSVHSGTVVSMREFGAFVQLGAGDQYKDGLLHVSCLGETRFEGPEEAGLSLGAKLWVKVSEVSDHELKYSLDMRYVSQRDGTDLDPYNARGRLPNNFWEGGKVKPSRPAAATAPPILERLSAHMEPKIDVSGVAPELGRKRKAAKGSDSDSSVDSEERAKVSKKLEKARKKLEKAKKKAEKARKKAEKKAKKKDKKGRKGEKAAKDTSSSSSSSGSG